MNVNKILETLIELTKLAVEKNAKVTLFYLPTPSYTGYIIALAKIEATNAKLTLDDNQAFNEAVHKIYKQVNTKVR